MRTAILIIHKDHELDPLGVNGGAETAVTRLAKSLASLGCQVVVGAILPEKYTTSLDVEGVRYEDLGRSYQTAALLGRLPELFGSALVHLVAASSVKVLAEAAGNRQIASRTFITHEPSAEAFGIAPSSLGSVADHVVCVSEIQRQLVISAGCPVELTHVIHNGVDLELFSPSGIEQRNWHRLMFAGALVVDKGVHFLIEAFAALKSKYPQLELDIYGSAEMWGREDYFDRAAIARQLPSIRFHGAVSHQTIADAYRGAGVLIQPSMYFDAFGLSVAEAQATGLPVIGSAKTGMREIIDHGETGLLLEEISTQSVAKAIDLLLSKPEMLHSMSVTARARKRAQFSWDKTAKSILQTVTKGQGESSVSVSSEVRPKISVGIPTYNRLSYLQEAVESVLAQEVPVHEIVIVDDGSTDGTQEYLSSIKSSNIRAICFEKNSGRPAARNRVVQEFSGDALLWLDDDDALTPDAVKTIYAALESSPKAEVVYGNLIVCDELMRPIDKQVFNPVKPELMLLHLVHEDVVPNPGTLIKRSVFDRVGGYNYEFPRCQDYEFWARAAISNAHFLHHGKSVLKFRRHGNNSANPEKTRFQSKYQCQIIQMMLAETELERIVPIFDWNSNPDQAAAEALMLLAKIFFDHGDDVSALECVELSLKCLPSQNGMAMKAFVLRSLGRAREAADAFAGLVSTLDPNLSYLNVQVGALRGSEAIAEAAKVERLKRESSGSPATQS